ncbi:ArsR family transcriptional regulator [Salibacterium salarium]|uniref:ArsR family transcriptional regulator n=1 Tax=Salibacterium salarium TaxID=284579 RepID=A0A428N280_9BACI|nr:metalloregulator ArsR/SmtB family transcription factor [Salibacterium salarium]RSL32407.1 ArsR family transcriptional regulator [Salibacterium salarium]
MSKYKYELHTIAPFSDMFKALSNTHRLQIFLYLANNCFPGELSTEEEMRISVGELGDGLNIAPSTVSHHLKELRQAGLIRMERKGKNIECWIEPETLDQLVDFFQNAKGKKQ